MKLNNQNYMAYGYGSVTIETLMRFYNDYGIACSCDGDDGGYFLVAEDLKKRSLRAATHRQKGE
ncbi:MAG: hypothetical protein J6D28_04515 [Bacilli bacterium]|nr:hypothetical protein [Bacilli bacterium]